MIAEGIIQDKKLENSLNRRMRRFQEKTSIKLKDSLSIESLLKNLDRVLTWEELNTIFKTDAYKYSHCNLYPEGLTKLVSYLESRGGKFEETVWFGLQGILKKHFVGEVLTMEMIEEADVRLNGEDGVFNGNKVFPKEVWVRLLEKHGGRLPVEIRTVMEGESVPVKNALMVIESTDEEFAWLTNFIESLILQVWYPIIVATLSREVKKVVVDYLTRTGTNSEMIPIVASYVLCDFGFRGVSSVESSEIGGSAHLINFSGSDNVLASDSLMRYYHAQCMLGKSVIATEHSIMTIMGEDGEFEQLERLLDQNPTGVIACVGDSYSIAAFVKHISTNLIDKILTRDGVFVIRPDSGDIEYTLKEIFRILFETLGDKCSVNTYEGKEFKVLPPQIRVLQGDGVNFESIQSMYAMLYNEGIAAENLVLGMGGKLLQSGLDRDTNKFAIKACKAIINGKEYDVIKRPMEYDSEGNYNISFKMSKKGLPKLVKVDGKYTTLIKGDDGYETATCLLIPIFRNGYLLVDQKIDEVIERAEFQNVA